jgi:hypothetical protein
VRVAATAANGYAAATNYTLVVTTGTVDGTSVVGYTVGSFSIENRYTNVLAIDSDKTAAENLRDDYDAAVGYSKILSSLGSVTGEVGGIASAIGVNTFDELISDRDADWSALAAVETGTLQSATATTAVLDDAPSTIIASGDRNDNDFLNRAILVITGGTGAGQQRKIRDYAGGTFTCTVRTWAVTPDSTSTYEILPDDSEDEELDAKLDIIEAQTDDIGTAGAGLTAVPWNASWDAEVQSEVADALGVYDPPTNAEMEARTIAAASYATATALQTVDDEIATIDTNVDAILDDTGTSGVVVGSVSLGADAIDADTLAADLDIYQAKTFLLDDDGGSADRYVTIWFKNAARVTSGITSPTIQVVKVADGADLIASTAMTEVGSTEMYRYTATTVERVTSGASYVAIVGATIDGSARSDATPVGRDST